MISFNFVWFIKTFYTKNIFSRNIDIVLSELKPRQSWGRGNLQSIVVSLCSVSAKQQRSASESSTIFQEIISEIEVKKPKFISQEGKTCFPDTRVTF